MSQGKQAILLAYEDIPIWQRDNEFVLSGYRQTSKSWKTSLLSIFAIHNETISIHTHLLGAILFYYLLYDFWSNQWTPILTATTADLIVFGIYCCGVAICFALSALCHVSWNHSAQVAALGNRLDYLGIVILMWGASVSSIYYGLHCDPGLQSLYWVVTTGSAIACAVCTMSPHFSNSKFRKWRATMYASLGLTGIVFALHGILLHGMTVQISRMSIDWMILMAVLNFIGVGVYTVRLPERRYPHTFDIVGGSHQIFHVMVILAGLAHMKGLLRAFQFARSNNGICM